MSIDVATLKCTECGSNTLKRIGANQYECEYCKAVAVVEDDVSQRLDRVLEQVKNAAADRLAAEQSARNEKTAKTIRIFAVLGSGAMAAIITIIALVSDDRSTSPSVSSVSGPASVPTDKLVIIDERDVVVRGQPKLLVAVRNTSDSPLRHVEVHATFFAGDKRLSDTNEDVPPNVLAPGETSATIVDLPASTTRHTVDIKRLIPSDAKTGAKLVFERSRLVQQGNEVRLIGRVTNDHGTTLSRIEALVLAYDASGAVIGIGKGYGDANTLRTGESTTVDAKLTLTSTSPIAAWDYRLGYHADSRDADVYSGDRVIRVNAGPESVSEAMKVSPEDLLADPSEQFDPKSIELTALISGRDTTHDPVYLADIVNRSKDTIALNPGAVISAFNGNKLDSTVSVNGIDALYPGERFPVRLKPKTERITQTRVEWKPMRKSALPGSRPRLTAAVQGTQAKTGSVLVNFSQRFQYKYVVVRGVVTNEGQTIAPASKVLVTLRDAAGGLSGFASVNVPATGPGDTAPFEVNVTQEGKDFKTVSTLVTR